MAREFTAGDVLIFQLESGFGLLKVLAVDESESEKMIWHLAAFEDLFLDADFADAYLDNTENPRFNAPHFALTNRAFESTQTARMGNFVVTDEETSRVQAWREDSNRQTQDVSIRLLLGLR